MQDTLKNEVYEQKYFTNKFRSSVQDNAYFPEVTHDDFEQQRLVNSDSVRCDLPIEKINHSIRDKVHKEYLESFSHLIKEMTDGKSKEIEVRILNAFTSAKKATLKTGRLTASLFYCLFPIAKHHAARQ